MKLIARKHTAREGWYVKNEETGAYLLVNMTGPDARLIAAAPELLEALRDLAQRADNTEVAGAGYSIDTAWASALLARIEDNTT